MSTHSLKLESDIDFVSEGFITLYDFHDENLLYDGKKYSVIDHDENGLGASKEDTKARNQQYHRIMIGNLFENNIEKNKYTKFILEKIGKYKYMKMRPSEMIVQVKEDIYNYFKEDLDTIDELKDIIRR